MVHCPAPMVPLILVSAAGGTQQQVGRGEYSEYAGLQHSSALVCLLWDATCALSRGRLCQPVPAATNKQASKQVS